SRLCTRCPAEVESSPSPTRPGHGTPMRAGLAESVDAVHSKCIVERRAGSSPASGTNPEPRPHRGRGSVSTRGSVGWGRTSTAARSHSRSYVLGHSAVRLGASEAHTLPDVGPLGLMIARYGLADTPGRTVCGR